MLKSQEKDRKSNVEINSKLLRRKCGHGGIFCSFADATIPMTAPALALEILNFRIATPGAVERVKAVGNRIKKTQGAQLYIKLACVANSNFLKFLLFIKSYLKIGPFGRAMPSCTCQK